MGTEPKHACFERRHWWPKAVLKKKIKSSTSLVVWKRQIKTKIRYHLTPVRMFMIKRQKIENPGNVSRKGRPCALWLGR